jgi:hypothetical protein
MERTDLMAGEGANRLRTGRLSGNPPEGELRREPNDRMLWKGTALMRFVHFPSINSVLSNADELRLQSNNVVANPMENGPKMMGRDGASELPHSNEGCDHTQGGTPRTPTARGPAVAVSWTVLHLNSNDSE